MLVPWSYLKSWECLACGHCCKDYAIPLAEGEWLGLSNLFGPSVAEWFLDKRCLRRGVGGRCVFLQKYEGHWLCGIQGAKPLNCRLFPFKVSVHPLFGRKEEASFPYSGREVFVYVDVDCRGIEWGRPGPDLVRKVLPEFVGLRLKKGLDQYYSTARIWPQRPLPPVRPILSACTSMDLPLAVIE